MVEKEPILGLMGLLTKWQRDIVILHFYYEETQGEIVKTIGVSQLAVSQALMAALRRIREG